MTSGSDLEEHEADSGIDEHINSHNNTNTGEHHQKKVSDNFFIPLSPTPYL